MCITVKGLTPTQYLFSTSATFLIRANGVKSSKIGFLGLCLYTWVKQAVSGEKNPCSGFPQSTGKQRCETRGRWWVLCCRFLPVLGRLLLLQKISLCWRQGCGGSRNSNPGCCRGCCSDHCGWDVLWFLDCMLTVFLVLELAGVKPEWVYLQSLQHSLRVALQTYTNTRVHTCTHTPHSHTERFVVFLFKTHLHGEVPFSLSSSPVCLSPSTTQQ